MIRVTIELLPFGFENNKKVLGVAEIWNDATGDSETGNYGFKIFGKNRYFLKSGEVKNFPRKRLLAWDLVYRCLREAYSYRNK